VINEKKSLAIELLIEGNMTKEDIAKRCDRSRQWLYMQVINDEECKAELNRRLQAIKTHAENKFNGKLDLAVDKMWEIINSEVDTRTREKALEYWIDKTMGKNTAKVEIDNIDKDKSDVDDILTSYNKFAALKEVK